MDKLVIFLNFIVSKSMRVSGNNEPNIIENL